MNRKLISTEEAVESDHQHTTPCSDCPWRRDSLNGWLGGHTPEEFLRIAHADTTYNCHAVTNQQCAGMAVYRRNTCKSTRPPMLTLPADHATVFSNRMQFQAHHEAMPSPKKP